MCLNREFLTRIALDPVITLKEALTMQPVLAASIDLARRINNGLVKVDWQKWEITLEDGQVV